MAFSVLSAADGAILRNRIGDTQSVLSDTVLDAVYTAAGLDLDVATVGALQQLLGIYAMQSDVTDSNTIITERRSQRYDKLQDLLKYWEGVTGTIGTALQLGTLDTGIDREATDTDLLDWY
jgi:hypothetical protein